MSYSECDYSNSDNCSEEEEDYVELCDANFDLFEVVGGDAQTHGSLKSYGTKDGGLIYYRDNTSFTISVERLIQADGYADSSKKERLTLFVLKIILACNSHSRIKRAAFNMRFEELPEKKRKRVQAGSAKVQPEVIAWGPFAEMARTNEIHVKRAKWEKVGVELKSGGDSVTGKGTAEWERTTEWTTSYWETAHSFATFQRGYQKPNGVRWVLNANPKDTQGLPPKLTVGFLLSRQSDEPYLVNFDIKVTGGNFDDLLKGIEKMLGRKPEATKPYMVKPSKEPILRATGFNMINRVNLHSMLELRGKEDSLVPIWDEEDEEEGPVASNPQ
ncbi:hypothetical protein V8C34DRAFT_287805 [Trichoderma compactum]